MKKTLRNIVSSVAVFALVTAPQVAFGKWDINDTKNNATNFGVSTQSFADIIKNIINYALAIIGLLGVLGFIISGIMYLVAAGDESLAEKAKKNMVNSIIGVIVALLGYVIMALIDTLLKGGSTGI